jgi:hypothetical protein
VSAWIAGVSLRYHFGVVVRALIRSSQCLLVVLDLFYLFDVYCLLMLENFLMMMYLTMVYVWI